MQVQVCLLPCDSRGVWVCQKESKKDRFGKKRQSAKEVQAGKYGSCQKGSELFDFLSR